MFCQKCGNELPDGVAFCNKCGNPINKPANATAPVTPATPVQNGAESALLKSKLPLIIGGGVVALLLVILIVVLASGNKKGGTSVEKTQTNSNLPTNYENYIGLWKVAGRIGHPDGMLDANGDYINITEKCIDCSDLFRQSCEIEIEILEYYNEDGNDYYVDPTGNPIGFYYSPSDNQIIVYTPSDNYPSDDPYKWNSRLRMERE